MTTHARSTWIAVLGAGLVVALFPGAGRAQQDPSGAWRTWTSEHFRVHARRELAPFAMQTIREAERAYALLSRELRPPRYRTDIALFDNVDASNGFTRVFPSNRIALFLAAPSTDISLGVYDDWVRLVTVHELTHVFHLSRADGVWRLARYVFGRNPALFPNAYQPSWVSEGLATYYESRFTTAGRLRGGFHGQLLAARAARAWPGPGDITFASPIWPAGFGPYAWGSRFFQLVAETYGDTTVPGFVDRSSRQVWPIALSGPLRAAGATGLRDAWTRLRDRWRPEEGGREGDGFDRVIARGMRSPPRIALAKDRQRLAFVHRGDREIVRVVVYDLVAAREVARRPVNGAVDLAWRGDTIYVTQLGFTSPVEIRSDLYRWVPGVTWQRVTWAGRLETPSLLEDGGLALVASGNGTRALVRLPAGPEVDTLSAPSGDDWGRLAASPDGRWVAAARHARGRWDIILWRPETPADTVLVTDDAPRDEDPSWTPDGRLVFSSERHGIPQVFSYDPLDGALQQLTRVPTGAREPHVTNAGSLVYSTMLADGYAVVVSSTTRPVQARGHPGPPPATVAPAPEVAVTEGGYNPWPALLPRYWIPVSHGEGSAGRYFGAQTGASDAIGRVSYGLTVTHAPGRGRWEASMAGRYSRWRRFAIDAGAAQTWKAGGFAETAAGDTVPLALRERLASTGLSWRWRRWRSSAAARVGAEVEQDVLVNDGSSPLGFTFRNPTVAALVATASVGYARRPPLAVSPEDGASLSVLYRRRWVLDGPEIGNEWRASLRGFLALPLPGFAHWVLAARVRGALATGGIITTFALGGASSGTFDLIPGVGVGGSRRTFPLRGYPVSRERFTRAVTQIVELRVPVLRVARGLWQLPVGLDRVSLALFGEAGGGWRAGERARITTFRDVGAELVLDLIAGYDTPVRLRGGVGFPLVDGLGAQRGSSRGYLSVGASF